MSDEKHSEDKRSSLRTRAEETLSRNWFEEGEIAALSGAEVQRLVHELRVHQIELEMQNEELRQAHLRLEELKDRYLDLYDFAPVGYFTLNDQGLILEANLTAVRLLDAERQSLIKTFFSRLVCQEDSGAWYLHLQKVLEAHSKEACEIKLTRKDGTRFHAQLESIPVQDANGSRCRTMVIDITERKRAEEALQESEKKFRAIFDTASVGIDLVDREGRFLEVNSTLSQFLGYSPEELRHRTLLDVSHPEEVVRSREMHEAMVRGETEAYRLEKRYVRKDGSTLWADTAVSAIRDADGQYRATVGVIRDITRQKKSDEVRTRLASAVEQTAETVVITDAEGTIVYVNPFFERTTGYSREEALGSNPRILKSGRHDDAFYKRMWDTLTSGQTWTGHIINKKKDGTLFEEDASISPVRDASGRIVNYVAVKRDITQEISLQTQLFQAQKMEAVGTLAGGVAHDFNNILQVALGYSELVLDDAALPQQFRADIRKIYESAQRGADLIQRLLMFSRKTEIKPQPLNLNRRITELRKMLERTLPKMIEIRLALREDIDTINGDPTQIDQVLMNLAVNARDAMPDGGELALETANVVLDDEYARTHLDARPGRHVLLTVTDTGSGMDNETLEHIFEPFYTTKAVGEGTGLGLAMVHGIVKQHGGHMSCRSDPGHGTAFLIYFPALISDEEPERAFVREMPKGGSETILLVDDEEFIRDLAVRILTKAGYRVIPVSNGKEALEAYQKWGTDIALVVVDLIMPEMGGKHCLEGLLALNPAVKVVVASGFSADDPTKDAIAVGAKAFVNKPYKIRQVLEVVRNVLDGE